MTLKGFDRPFRFALSALATTLCFFFLATNLHAQAVSGTITGSVTDPSGAVISDASVSATDAATGAARDTKTDSSGHYTFVYLPIGTYNLIFSKQGFKSFASAGVVVNAGQVYTANAQLTVGTASETVTVEATRLQVQTNNTQLGTVISGSTIENMPIINRDPLTLMQLEPGVMASSDRFGSNSVNGSQTQQNSYEINGTDFNDVALNTPMTGHLAPNPDAIAQFSLITNTLNPEYGRNSGAIVNQVVKSGTNQFHGSASEFYRDTFLNATDYFASQPQIFHRNIFDGTLGGPIVKNHLFGFFSYEGLRQRSAATPVLVTVFTPAELAGNFGAGFLNPPKAGAAPIPEYGDSASSCPVGGAMCPAGTAYSSLFSTGVIPTQDFNATALKYVTAYNPAVNFGTDQYSAQFPNLDSVNQYLWRVDDTISSKDALWGYGYIEKEGSGAALPFTGANVPGFAEVDGESISNYTVSWNHIFSSNAINQFSVGYMRFNFVAVEPANPTLPSTMGFAINPQFTSAAGLPFIGLPGNDINLGFSTNGPQPRIDQNYQVDDNLSYIFGKHQLKFGFDGRRFWTTGIFGARNNGSYTFTGAGTYSTGDPFADLLLGFPDSYSQSSGGPWNGRSQEFYSYAQDSWSARPDLTVNYGIAWQINTPWVLPYNNFTAINCFRPGEQSLTYPSAPMGVVYPGDANCTSSGYHTQFNEVGPRLGLAWSPDFGRLSGGAGNFSIRAGAGIYYNQTESEGTLQNIDAPPLQLSDAGFADALGTAAFQNPFAAVQCLDQQNNPIAGCAPVTPGGTPLAVASIANKYPFTAPPKGDANIDFSNFGPLSLNLLDPNYHAPYTVNYNLTMQRQLTGNMLLSVGYVGLEGRHNQRTYELNPLLNPTECAATPSCADQAPFQYLAAPSSANPTGIAQYRYGPQAVPSFVTPAPGASEIVYLASLQQQTTDGNSHYNSLQASLQKTFSHGLDFLVSYTWAHAIDDGSNLEDLAFNGLGTNTFLPELNWGDSAFDARQRLVVSYDYTIPMPSSVTSNGWADRALGGWRISGITTAQTGFPVTVTNPNFTSLTCNAFSFFSCPDNLEYTGQALDITDPRSNANAQYFNPAAFTTPALGTFGNVRRNSFHGPGLWNTDLALYKDTHITERMTLQLRMDAQNAFNHVQFSNPDGNFNSSSFGDITSTFEGPRILQLGARFMF